MPSETKSLFDTIDDVPWADLAHAYGPATDVPDLLRALMTPGAASKGLVKAARKNRRSLFEQVTWTLWGNVFHQGSVWPVTATTVPFFAEILRDGPRDPDLKEFLITYLHNLAIGYPEDVFPDMPNPDTEFEAVSEREGPGGEPGDDDYLICWRDSYHAVERHIDDVLPYLDAEDDLVAEAAIAMCASFPRRAEQTVPQLRRLAAAGGRRGANAAVSLAVLVGADARRVAVAIAESEDRHTAILGACASVLADPDDIPPKILSILTLPLEDLDKAKSAHAFTLSSLIGRCLQRLGPEHKGRAAAGVARQLVAATALESVSLTQSLLLLVFEQRPPKDAADLTPTQRMALEAIRDHGAFIVSRGTFANYASLLQNWGLPETAEDIGAWLRAE